MTGAMTDKAREAVVWVLFPWGVSGVPRTWLAPWSSFSRRPRGYVTGQVIGVDGGFHM